MKVIAGRIVQGRVEVGEGFGEGDLAEGSPVVVLALDPGEPIHLSEAQETELREASEAIRRGESVDAESLLAELRSGATV